MIAIQRDGSLAWNSLNDLRNQAVGTLELPAEVLDQQSDVFDRVFAFAFDVLRLHTLELRIRPYLKETHACDREDSVSRSGGWPSKGSKLLPKQDAPTGSV
jgi:hypothetical protein